MRSKSHSACSAIVRIPSATASASSSFFSTDSTSGRRLTPMTLASFARPYLSAIVLSASRYPFKSGSLTRTIISSAIELSIVTKTSTLPRLMCELTACFIVSSANRKLRGNLIDVSKNLLFTLLSSTLTSIPSTVPFALP